MPKRSFFAALVAVALVFGVLTAPAAQAELTHSRQQWLREATSGLFLHWGMFTAPLQTDCATWERNVTEGGWTPDYWIDEAIKLHAQYVVLASFHSRLGYARAWPSEVPGSCSTKRDFLGELVKAGNAKNIKVVLYMTDDPQWHDQRGVESLDSAAYSAYKGKAVDLTTRDGFGEYSYDLWGEVLKKYDGLSGFWVDNDNAYWERNKLYERVRAERPTWTLSNNNEDTPIMDMVSHEQKTGMTPAYDYPQAANTPAPRMMEACFKLPSKGAWWYDGSDSDIDYALTLGRLISNAGSSVRSLMAETAMVNGKFPPKQEAFNNFAKTYLDAISESIRGVEGGGYLYGGLVPGFWNDGAHGVTTVSKTKPDQHYVHVLTKPATATSITLRDNGYRVDRVRDLRTGERKRFTQSGGFLTIEDITSWDQYDTVFKVETAGREGLLQPVSATASAERGGFPAANLVDRDYLTYWDSNTTVPVSFTLDLGKTTPVAYLAANQREWSVSYQRSATEDSARIKDYRLETSADGTTWTLAKAGVLPSARGAAFIDLPPDTTARHLRLNVDSTWAAPTATNFHRKLRVDELWAGSDFAGRAPHFTGLSYEAENGWRQDGATVVKCESCSGGRKVESLGSVTIPVLSLGGDHVLALVGAAEGTGSVSVQVNRADVGSVSLTGYSRTTPLLERSLVVRLKPGLNVIRVHGDPAKSLALDRVAIRPA